ncbi:MAG: NAD(P)-dependent oxidoreductase [Phycisphaeraceae bacterium]
MIKRIGYVGLGIMGLPMAKNLLDASYELTVWNRTAEKAQPLLDSGARWADTPADLAEHVEAICVNVTNTTDVEEVIFGRHGIVAGNPGDTAGMVIVDHSTISPDATRRFADRLAAQEIEMLDAPVSGGDVGAKAGTLAIMVGGKEAVFRRCQPFLEVVGKTVTHVGAHGTGQACKACNQVMVALNLLGVCEAMGLAAKEGLDIANMIAVTEQGAAGSWQLSNLGPRLAKGDTAPGFMIDLIDKDLSIVSDEAKRLGLPMPGTSVVSDLFRAAVANGLGGEGTQALGRMLEQLGAFSFQND